MKFNTRLNARLIAAALPAVVPGIAGGSVHAAPAPPVLTTLALPSSGAPARNSATKGQAAPPTESRSAVAAPLRVTSAFVPAPDGKGWKARATLPSAPPRPLSGLASRSLISPSPAPRLASSAVGAAMQPAPPTATPASTPINAGATAATPTTLASRHTDRDRLLLEQLEADLQRTRRGLSNADADLSEVERQLARFTNTLRQAMLEAGPDARGLHPFVRVAQRYAGTPYVWGGESGRGFDCSGFIIRVMRDLGYRALPHSAATQFNYGKPIAQVLLKPGDLVFFANTYKPGISHVGIYLGRRRFIHAAGTGTGTIVSSLDNAKYQAKYAGARRLIAARR